MRLRELPEIPEFDDTPPWQDNIDSVEKRAVNVAWAWLFEKDLSELTYKDLAEGARVTPAAVYYHFPTLTHLAEHITSGAFARLKVDIFEAFEKGKDSLGAIEAILRFAHKRPRHFALLTSPRFAETKGVKQWRGKIDEAHDQLLENILDRKPREGEQLRLRLILYGGATLISTKAATVKDVQAMLASTLSSWKTPSKRR